MLDTIFMRVLDMTAVSSVVILVVLLARLLLKRAPKIFSYALWAVVLFRLLCPVSIQAPVAVVPEIKPVAASYSLADVPISFAGASAAARQAAVDALNGEAGIQHIPTTAADSHGGVEQVESNWWEVWVLFGQYVWLAGVGAMAAYSLISLLRLRRRLAEAVVLKGNIYLADRIDSPFVLGLLRPRIYLPSALSDREQGYILLHEQHHIRRGDHLFKALAFLALCIHWFNPLVWAAFILSAKDMEMSCDEAVVNKLGEKVRGDYSASLLSLATGRRIIAGTPLAFGEGDTGSRIRNLLRWKRPKVWITAAAAVLCLAVVAACAADPESEPPAAPGAEPLVNDPAQQMAESGRYGTAADIAYCLELAAGEEFQDMDGETQRELLAEYGDLLTDYTFLARETLDGRTGYILAAFNGEDLEKSPLRGLLGIERYAGAEYPLDEDGYIQVLYREGEFEAIDEALTRGETPPVGYPIKKSRLYFPDHPEVVLILPESTALDLDVVFNRYLFTPNGRAYIADASERGVDLCGRTETCLYVYRVSEAYGEIAERFALTEAEAAAILSEERQEITAGFGFSASLHTAEGATIFSEVTGVPRSVLDLAVERCDYRFADSDQITGDILGAVLTCDWLDTPLHADPADLPRLKEILKGAQFEGVGSCSYGARLTLELTGGEQMTIFKGTDDCGSLVFGSYSGYALGEAENAAFWEIFGLDPWTKAPLADIFPLELLYASGASSWGTTLTLQRDGTFTGEYYDHENVAAPEYPHGTVYINRFSGRFSQLERINDYTYTMRLEELRDETRQEGQWIQDQMRYIAAEAVGLAGGEEFRLYLPGTPAAELDEAFLDWWPEAWAWREGKVDSLSGYGLYNVNSGAGFFSSAAES